MIYILTDPGYSDSIWCRNFLFSLTEQLRKNRMNFAQAFDAVPADAQAVFIIAADYNWTRNTIRHLNSSNIFPILISNNTEHLSGCVYSSVSSDICNSIKQLLTQIGDKPAALYGVNIHSLSDISKVDLLLAYSEEKTQKPPVFYNEGSLENCFSDFYERGDGIGAVICTNDLAAVSLVRNLRAVDPARLEKLEIYSLTGGTLSKYYSPYIKSLEIDYSPFGRAAIHLYKLLLKHDYLTTLSAKVSWTPSGKSGGGKEIKLVPPETDDGFNRDGEIREMMSTEKLLDSMDDVDRNIVKGILASKTLAEIADECFLSENALKYRLKKILANTGFPDRQTLARALKKYIHSWEEL